jgi:hypothetical protein
MSTTGTAQVRAWATRSVDGRVRLIVINADLAHRHVVSIRRPQHVTATSVERLEAPSATATAGVTLAGQSIVAQTRTGTLRGALRTSSLTASDGPLHACARARQRSDPHDHRETVSCRPSYRQDKAVAVERVVAGDDDPTMRLWDSGVAREPPWFAGSIPVGRLASSPASRSTNLGVATTRTLTGVPTPRSSGRPDLELHSYALDHAGLRAALAVHAETCPPLGRRSRPRRRPNRHGASGPNRLAASTRSR